MATQRTISESDDRDFDVKLVKLSDIKSYFTCTICTSLFSGTSTIKCGHRFCAHCIQIWFQRQQKCPVCNQQVRVGQETRDHQFDDLLRTIEEKAVSEADVTARQLESDGKGTYNNNGPSLLVDHKLAEVLCTLLPQKDRDLKEMMDKLIAEKDKTLQTLKEKDLSERDKTIQLLHTHAKKLEEEVKQIKALQEKLEKSRQSEAKCNEEKHLLKGELQRVNGELTTLKTVDVTRQQQVKELYGQMQKQVAEIQAVNMYLDEKTKVAEKADRLQTTVNQLEKDLQQRINEVTYLQQFVMFKDLYDQRNQEVNSLEQDLSRKDTTILDQQDQISSMNDKIMALSKQIQETPLSIHQAQTRYQKQLQEMEENMRALYEEESQDKRTLSTRRLSSDEDRVGLICKNVPIPFNSGQKLRQHFTKFGEVIRVIPKPAKGIATIHFKTHEAALEAKRKGAVIMKGEKTMQIFWSSFSPAVKGLGQKSSTEDGDVTQGHVRRQVQGKAGASQFKFRRNEVDEELASMSGTSDIIGQKQHILPRSEEVRGQQSQSTEPVMRHASPVQSETSSSPAIPTKIDKGAVISLKNSFDRSNSDKLQILNLRDKVNRLGPKKQSDLATARAFVGTCTDMCPEKERYDREEKCRLHPYEVLQTSEGSGNPLVNHALAVKEYSRSSADQEEPLPYELRTLPTLTLTMTYLLSEIVDRGEDCKWGDWFYFLWNRTRGIRKEITQQQFCNVESVELLEKCVRFHIFCAERLCEEDMHSFDDKINNENMTKCLQTLKENYSDLEKKQVFCVNEAEMRCYMVLMNLNERDILRETQQLRPEVWNSTLINYALKVYAALNSNNYVRFFRLVREGSFLCSCILHRYFTQLRKKALYILVKAHAHQKGVQLPLEDLVRTLSFDDQSEAAQFCQFFGLTTVDNCVTLDKATLIEPEENWYPQRSALIERKLNTSIGEAIYGGPLPAFSLREPENSFDNNGKYIGQIIIKDSDFVDSPRKDAVRRYNVPDQTSVSTDKMAVPQPTLAPKVKVTYTNEEVKETAKFLFWEVIDNMCLEIGQESKHEVDKLMDISQFCMILSQERLSLNLCLQRVFSQDLLRTLACKEGSLKSWAACNRGCFTLLFLLEVQDHPEITDTVISQLSGIRSSLKKMTFRGAQLLLQKLDALSGEYKL